MKISSQTTVLNILKKAAKVVKDMTIVCPLVELIVALATEKLFIRLSQTPPAQLSPLAKKRLKENEVLIHSIARQAGILHPERLKIYVGRPYGGIYAAGSSALSIPPERLLKKEDFPEHLSLDKFQRGEISDYFFKLGQWLTQEFTHQKEVKKIGVDTKIWFKRIFPFNSIAENVFRGIVGHEIAHCVSHDAKKKLLFSTVLRILSLPTLGLTLLFEDRLMRRMLLRHEKEADLFSARKVRGARGLISLFVLSLEYKQSRYRKFPQNYDQEGNERNDPTHPPMTQRIAYLWPYLSEMDRRFLKDWKKLPCLERLS
ncbi:MAG: hypothetical protein LLG04_10335 [Parachlamydia sp.]|nr:hypothetical protein [Parachlamydia sp.]